jgi:hypothetical protein
MGDGQAADQYRLLIGLNGRTFKCVDNMLRVF